MHPPSPTAVNGSAPHLAGRIFLTGDTAGVLCILRGQHAGQQPRSGDTPLDGPRRCRCLHDGIALSTGMFFPYRPDNPEGATHQLQLFGGILAQIAQ